MFLRVLFVVFVFFKMAQDSWLVVVMMGAP